LLSDIRTFVRLLVESCGNSKDPGGQNDARPEFACRPKPFVPVVFHFHDLTSVQSQKSAPDNPAADNSIGQTRLKTLTKTEQKSPNRKFFSHGTRPP
jgi:hypothetical protein